MTFANVGMSAETDERQSDRKPELPHLEAEERLASVSGKSLRPSREQQPEDRDERQDGGHARGIGRNRRPPASLTSVIRTCRLGRLAELGSALSGSIGGARTADLPRGSDALFFRCWAISNVHLYV